MILVTGGSGQLGTSFRRLLPEAAFPTRNELDLASPKTLVRTLDELRPTTIINCAAYTAVDPAEEEEELASTVNGSAVGVLADYASSRGIPLVTYSTDYVFDGAGNRPYVESDATDPINAYGRSKRIGEVLALDNDRSLVIRTSWVISGTHPNFVATMLRLVATHDQIKVIDDQEGCPTITDDLASATLQCLQQEVTGLLHLTNQGPTTWFELAKYAVAIAGLDANKIVPCTTEEYPLPAPRPRYSVLGSERLSTVGVTPLPRWEDSIAAVVGSLQGR